jgi:hypothetical protein
LLVPKTLNFHSRLATVSVPRSGVQRKTLWGLGAGAATAAHKETKAKPAINHLEVLISLLPMPLL